MPVTTRPTKKIGNNSDHIATSSKEFLETVVDAWKDAPVLHSSFNDLETGNPPKVIAYGNGFVHGVIRAYQQDLHLVLRPDDVWLAIITQFGFYVTGHAEELRSKFVAHKGQEKLVLKVDESFHDLDVGNMARRFTCLIEEYLVDKDVRNWLIPDFSTTTDHDMAVAALTMMATMKHYFNYEAQSDCGFPSVTLLGEKEDWENIRRRLDRFELYGDEPKAWSELLIPILDRFVTTFDDPDNVHLKIFWEEVCYAEGEIDSGSTDTFSGWITAFAYWKSDGQRNKSSDCFAYEKQEYQLDDQIYPIIDQSDVTTGVMEVPLVFKAFELGTEFDTMLVAGSVGVTVTDGTQEKPGTALQPRSGWWMFEKSQKPIEE